MADIKEIENAIEEKAEREKGCKSCKGVEIFYTAILKYNYCPICGRKLNGGKQ